MKSTRSVPSTAKSRMSSSTRWPTQILPLQYSLSFVLFSLYALQEKQDDTDNAEVLVKIFVEFNERIEVLKAKNALDGRLASISCMNSKVFQVFRGSHHPGFYLRPGPVRTSRLLWLEHEEQELN